MKKFFKYLGRLGSFVGVAFLLGVVSEMVLYVFGALAVVGFIGQAIFFFKED